MHWIGLIVGLVAAGLLGAAFGGFGHALVLGVIAGVVMHQRQRLELMSKELAALKQRLAQPVAAVPVAAAEPAPIAAFEPPLPVPEPPPFEAPKDDRDDQPDTIPLPLHEPPPAPAQPRLRPETGFDERAIAVTSSLGASLQAWFRGGNTIVRVAVLILFIGVAFLLRYAAEHTRVPLELRLAGVALAGAALTALGLRLTPARRGYGLSLQGAGLGIVYLTLFAAYRLYELLPGGLAFALLAAMAAITTVLALRQDALPLAALGFGGAFLAPVLASTGQGSHVGLFSYYLLLNVAIALIARHKAWKLLNLEGFLFTFGIGAAWGFKAYTPALFWSTEAFLLAHFALYLFITVQYTQRLVQAASANGHRLPLVDGSLLFGTPIVAFGLQAAMLHNDPLELALSAAGLSGIYLLLGQWLWKRAGRQMLLLVEGMVALGLVFLALVTPLALDARWTSAAWGLQGQGVLWIALRQRRWWAVAMGLLLQVGAAASFWLVSDRFAPGLAGTRLFFNSGFLAAALLAATALASARLLLAATGREGTPRLLAMPLAEALMLGLGLLQLWWGCVLELDAWNQERLDDTTRLCLLHLLLALGCLAARRPLGWPTLRWPARVFTWSALAMSAAVVLDDAGWHRFAHGLGLIEALALIGLGRWMLRQVQESDPPAVRAIDRLLPAWYAMLQGGVFLYTLGAHFVARHEGWTPAAAIVLPTLLALAILQRSVGHLALYRRWLLQPWLVLLMLWVLLANAWCDAGMAPLPYLPLLNPLDLAHGLVLLYALKLGVPRPLRLPAAALAFWWLNGLLIRTLHHWSGTPMWLDGALDAPLVQTGLSVLWTASALVTMLYATRRAEPELERRLWLAGAVLLGVVVLKLFLVDLSNLGSLTRIVSFLGVGGLMLVIGYVAPIPPASPNAPSGAEEKNA